MDVYTRIREIIYRFGVFFVVGALLAGNCLEADGIYVYHSQPKTWPQAQEICAADGMILVKINSEQKLTELMTMDTKFGGIISGGEIWTGMDTTSRLCSGYTWDSGDTATWFKWDNNEPDKCASDTCVRLKQGLMRTITCSKVYPFICQSQQGNMTCHCDGNTQNNAALRLRGIVPYSTAHHRTLLMAGYTPACPIWGNGSTSLNREEQLALLSALQNQLNVAKKTTSLYKLTRISALDNRPSATSVGAVGICLLLGLFGIVVAIDASRLYSYCKNRNKI